MNSKERFEGGLVLRNWLSPLCIVQVGRSLQPDYVQEWVGKKSMWLVERVIPGGGVVE